MKRSFTTYALSILAVVAAVLVRLLLAPILGETLPLVTLYAAVAFAAWFGGSRAALLGTVLGYFACARLFIREPLSDMITSPRWMVGFAAYFLTCFVIIRVVHEMRRAQRQAESGQESMRVTIASVGDAVITSDEEGRIASLNPVAETLTAWTEAEAIGRPLAEIFRVRDEWTRNQLDDPGAHAMQSSVHVRPSQAAILVRSDGSECSIDFSASPIRDREGHAIGSVLVFRDVSERRRGERENVQALNAARFLAAIVESSGDAIVSKSLDGTIQSWNLAAERLFGYRESEVVGKHISLIIPPDRLAEEDHILGRIRQAAKVDHFETVRLHKDGTPIHVSLTISPIRDKVGNVVGASKIIRDIRDRKLAEERIYSLVAELETGDRHKDEFLAMLGHELRGPLTPLRSMLDVLMRAPGNREIVERATATMDRQLKFLVRLVDDLLDVGRITRGRIDLRLEPLDLTSIVLLAVESVRPMIDAAGHELTVELPPQPIHVHADGARMTQVLNNLLINACKYTERGGRIWLTLERESGHAVIRVRDTGFGIPADKFGRVFEMFGQVDATLGRAQGGLGVGLALARRLVEMHEGELTVQSDGANLGSEFAARLPISTGPVLETVPPALPEPSRHRILVVDDNPDGVATLAMLLGVTGNEVRTASDGLEAVRVAEEFRPDLLLLDLGLPRLGGLDACRLIREQEWGKNIFIVAVTGWGQDEDRRRSKDAGFDEHMVKPLEYDALRKLLSEIGAAARTTPPAS